MSSKLTEQKVVEFKVVFDSFDENKNGTIEQGELGQLMKSIGIEYDETELLEMYKTIDTNQNGTICFDEFCNLIQIIMSELGMEENS